MKGCPIEYSPLELEFIRRNSADMTRRNLTELFNLKFGRSVKVANIASLCKRKGWLTGRTGRFEKGNAPFNAGTKGVMKANKTSFKKGTRPHNYRPVGSERINVDGYIEVKVEDPRKWELKHVVEWRKRFGAIPKGHKLVFKDNNKLNIDTDNLLLVSSAEHLYINRNGLSHFTCEGKRVAKHIASMNIALNDRLRG